MPSHYIYMRNVLPGSGLGCIQDIVQATACESARYKTLAIPEDFIFSRYAAYIYWGTESSL